MRSTPYNTMCSGHRNTLPYKFHLAVRGTSKFARMNIGLTRMGAHGYERWSVTGQLSLLEYCVVHTRTYVERARIVHADDISFRVRARVCFCFGSRSLTNAGCDWVRGFRRRETQKIYVRALSNSVCWHWQIIFVYLFQCAISSATLVLCVGVGGMQLIK